MVLFTYALPAMFIAVLDIGEALGQWDVGQEFAIIEHLAELVEHEKVV
jgi:hypothetical protein